MEADLTPREIPHAPFGSRWSRVALIVLATLWIYSPVIHGDWLWDDKPLIRDNPYYIQSTAGLWHIWTDPSRSPDFDPLLQTAEWMQWRLWHDNVAGYHLVNIALHILSALLLWRLFDRLGLRMAWLSGLLFAIQPIHVESVAWMAELKNTLSLPPFLLAMIAWVDFDRTRRRGDFASALGWFIVAMLCKATMTLFPLVILLHAWWRRGRIVGSDFITSAPFFAVSLLVGGLAWWFQQAHAFKGLTLVVGGFPERAALVSTTILFYLRQCLAPMTLLPIYERWPVHPPTVIEFVPLLLIAAVFAVCWWKRKTWGRHVLFGLGFFLLNLAPFVGLTIPYFMDFSWVTDHVLYIPSIGITALIVVGIAVLHESPRPAVRALLVPVAAGYCIVLAILAHGYSARFVDQATLWTYTLERNPNAWPAHHNLGNYFARNGHFSEAITHYRKAIELNPADPNLHLSLANTLFDSGKNDEAIEQYHYAIQLDPANKQAHLNLANLLLKQGHANEAAEQFRAGLQNESSYQDYLKEVEKVRSASH